MSVKGALKADCPSFKEVRTKRKGERPFEKHFLLESCFEHRLAQAACDRIHLTR